MYCFKCGQSLRNGAVYCPHCGTRQADDKDHKGFASRMMSGVTDRVEGVYGGGRHVNLEFKHFFSQVRIHHSKEEAEEIFIYGTPSTTPTLKEASYQWRRPWLYSRMLLVLLVSLAGLLAAWIVFANPNVLPGIILLGSFAMPFSTLVFFYEMNVPRNISFLEMLKDFFMGGVASIIVAHPLLYILPAGAAVGFFPALLTGIIEEFAKLAIVAFVMHRSNEGRYLLNGLLFGAAVGAGFSSFESAGYAFTTLLVYNSSISMMANIIVRGLLAIGGHVAWAAISGAALSIALDRGPFTWKVFGRAEFWGLFALPIAFHTLWDWLTIFACIPLVIGVWIVLLVLIRRGFWQINLLSQEAE